MVTWLSILNNFGILQKFYPIHHHRNSLPPNIKVFSLIYTQTSSGIELVPYIQQVMKLTLKSKVSSFCIVFHPTKLSPLITNYVTFTS